MPEIFADAVPPAEASVLDLAYGRIRIHHDADVVRADDFLDKQVVDADIHIQVVEPPAVEIEAFRVTDVVLGAAEGFPPRRGGQVAHRGHQATATHPPVGHALFGFDAAVTDDHVPANKSFGHQRQPFLGNGVTVLRREYQVLVTRRFDPDRQGQLDAVFVMALLPDAGYVQVRHDKAFFPQDLPDLVVVAAIDQDDFEFVVLLS